MTTTTTRRINIDRKYSPCPRCGTMRGRHSIGHRRLYELGTSHPVVLLVEYSKHYCPGCNCYFTVPMDHLAPKAGRYTHRVRCGAIELVVGQGLTFAKASDRLWKCHYVRVPVATLFDWVNQTA